MTSINTYTEQIDSQDRKSLAHSVIAVLKLHLHNRSIDLYGDNESETGKNHLSSTPLIEQEDRC